MRFPRLLLLFFLIPFLWNCKTPRKGPPNVILVLTDDQGYGDLSLHGNDSVDTPILDQFAAEGARLERFYVSPLCAPSRASLLTGRYHLRTGTYWVTKGTETMRSEEVTLAEVFKANDYATGCFGKWHNGEHYPYNPAGQGFDEFVGFCGGHWSNYFDPLLQRQDSMVATTGFITDILTDSAISFIRRNKDKPFFCYVPYNAPHAPFQVPDKYFDKYKTRGISDKNAAIYGMCENIDDNMGRLLASLNDLGLEENTIVIYLTDNGPNGDRFNGGMRGRKAQVHEGGVRVPCFIRWPEVIPAGTIIEELTAHIDILPTLIDLCGIKAPRMPPSDGVSLDKILRGKKEKLRDREIFTHVSLNTERKPLPGALRNSRYRFVMEKENEPQLYDMQADPAEAHNLAAAEPELTQKFKEKFNTTLGELTASMTNIPPIPLGYEAAKTVTLSAHEAAISGGLNFTFAPQGWAHDWLTNWKTPKDQASWDIEVIRPGNYRVSVLYTCKAEGVGSQLEVSVGGQKLTGEITEAFTPEISQNRDRVPHRVEALDQTWAEISLGTLALEPWSGKLILRSPTIVGEGVGEIKAVVVRYE
ncbi:MAG: arylsulfatase [Bacteroidia bacterium]|nr:arylsulfatase [Bacteroidia bacterium]